MIDPTATIESNVSLGTNVRVWRNSHIREHASIGNNVIIGENVYIGLGVIIGNDSKIQNGALIYEPAIIKSGVFIGPGVCLTNDKFPRAVNDDETIKSISDWNAQGVVVEQGASLGAGVVCVSPSKIGQWAMVGAGSVVTSDVCDFGLYVGNPAKQIGWVNKQGYKLQEMKAKLYCKETEQYYILIDNQVTELAH